MSERVAVLGASSKPDRYSNKAVRMLLDYGHQVVPVHPVEKSVYDQPVVKNVESIEGAIDTVTVYLSPRVSGMMADNIVALKPKRVILNPGAESPELEEKLEAAGIPFEHACTLVMLRTDQF